MIYFERNSLDENTCTMSVTEKSTLKSF